MALRCLPIAAATIAACLFFADASAAEPSSLGRFRDWEAYSATEQGKKICYTLTSPQKSEGDYAARDPVFLMVTRRPAEDVYDEVSAIGGYTYQAKNQPVFSIDSKKFVADAVGDVAWPKLRETPQLVATMRTGSTIELRGTSSRGTQTMDSFSLLGVSAALNAIAKSCPNR